MNICKRISDISSLTITCAVLIFFEMPNAIAQTEDYTKFSLSVGVFLTNMDTKTRIDGMVGDGTDVDLEGDLGLDNSDTVFRIDGYYRFNQKHRLDFSVFDLSRSASTLIEKDIEWNDTLFPIGTTIDSSFDLNIYKLAYTWSFMRRDKGYLGLTAGLYVADIGTRLTGENVGSSEGRALYSGYGASTISAKNWRSGRVVKFSRLNTAITAARCTISMLALTTSFLITWRLVLASTASGLILASSKTISRATWTGNTMAGCYS